jgi:membrane associated rhomboid family serine protease
MRQPTSLGTIYRYPVISAVTAMAIILTVRYVSPGGPTDLERFLSNRGDCLHEPWRLLVPGLFHEGGIHLLFNLYWIWVFGMVVEDAFGHLATLAILIFLAVGSMAAELALFRGGVGLSGVGYGLFGLLWVLGRKKERFHDVVDHSVIELMLGWLLVCIILTMADVWHVGNVAHCAGCLLGVMLGWVIAAPSFARQLLNGAVLSVVFLAMLAFGTTPAREWVNLVDDPGAVLAAEAAEADRAFRLGEYELSIDLYKKALATKDDVDCWRQLAKAYLLCNKRKEADDANRRADDLIRKGARP